MASELFVNVNVKSAEADPDAGALLAKLTKVWQQYHGRGVGVRYQTGLLLNQQFGSPKGRQKYGAKTFGPISKSLGVAESDLSRMRWFAHRFPSLEDFRKDRPSVRTWTDVKRLLAELRLAEKEKAAAAAGRPREVGPANGPFRVLMRKLGAARKGLAGLRIGRADPERPQLVAEVEKLLAFVAECTGDRYVRVSEDEVPPAQVLQEDLGAFGGTPVALVL